MSTGQLTLNILVAIGVIAFFAYLTAITPMKGESKETPQIEALATQSNHVAGALTEPLPASQSHLYQESEAINLAGDRVPAGVEGFYFMVVDANRDSAEQAAELASMMVKAASENDYLGVASADPQLSEQVMLMAFAISSEHELRNMRLIYVSGRAHQAAIKSQAARAGIALQYVVYP